MANRFQLRVFPLGYTVVDTKNGEENVTQQVGEAYQSDFPKGVSYVLIRHIADAMVEFANREMNVDIKI